MNELNKFKRYKFVISQSAGDNENINKYKLTDDSLKKIYDFELKSLDNTLNNHLVNSVYGEILFDSVQTLINECNVNDSDVFYDLGSGNGKVVLQMYINGGVKESYGIEFYPERCYNAEIALKNMYKMFPEYLNDSRIVSYQQQNIKDVYYLNNATVIFMCSTCYPGELLDVVYDKIKESKNIRCIITHKEYTKFNEFSGFVHKTLNLPCTWSNNLMWHIYIKSKK